MNGSETFGRLKTVDTGARVLLSSGCRIDGEASIMLDKGWRGFIQKPFSLDPLARKIREALE